MNARYIPENSAVINAHNATIYTYTSKDNKPAAIAYIGKSAKKLWHYRFMNDAQRMARIMQLLEDMKTQEEYKAKRKAEKKSFSHNLKVGQFLYASWGYDQTNIDYYQITTTTEKTVTFQEVTQSGEYNGHFMTGTCSPVRNSFKNNKEYTRPVRVGNYVHFAEYKGDFMKSLTLWDGTPKHYSDYA